MPALFEPPAISTFPLFNTVNVVLPRAKFIGLMLKNPGVTVSVAGALVIPLEEAVICVVPGSRPVTMPFAELIVATLVALLDQLKLTPLIVLPPLSFAVAEICSVPVTAMEVTLVEMAIVATAGGTLFEE
jgi:hypothetical protein